MRATDAVGNVEGTPVTRSFSVVDTPPPSSTPAPTPTTGAGTGNGTLIDPLDPAKTTPAAKNILFPSLTSCASRRKFTLHLKALKATLTSVTVKVAGKKVKALTGRHVTAIVSLTGLPKRKFTVTIDVKGTKGFKYHESRTYKTCTAKNR